MIRRFCAFLIILVLCIGLFNINVHGAGSAVISVEKFTIGQGYIIKPIRMELYEGETVASLLARVVGEGNVENTGDISWNFYLSGVYDGGGGQVNIPDVISLAEAGGRSRENWLCESDYAPSSGWVYCVNDEIMPYSASEYKIQDGDVVRWQFSVQGYGTDIRSWAMGRDNETVQLADMASSSPEYTSLLSRVSILGGGGTYERPSSGGVPVLPKYDWIGALDSVLLEYEGLGARSGEWALFALARRGEVDEDTAKAYYEDLSKTLKEKKGVLDTTKYTEYSRAILTLSALGIDPRAVAGYDLVENIKDIEKVSAQGINGVVFGAIALDSKKYGESTKFIQYIKEREKYGGGFSLDPDKYTGDTDITAMVLQCLVPYRDNAIVSEIINRGLYNLTENQDLHGGFVDNMGVVNAESTAQVIMALSALGINPEYDDMFAGVYGNPVSALMSFYIPGGGFSHMLGGAPDPMASEQGVMALVAYERFKNGLPSLYDLRGVEIQELLLPQEEKKEEVIAEQVYFEDIEGHWGEEIIEYLAGRGIVNGFSKTLFAPNQPVTRAEFSKIIVDALGQEADTGAEFLDVSKDAWYYNYVGTAKKLGIVTGVTKTEFSPNSLITREAAATMMARAAVISGLDAKLYSGEDRDILSGFIDYTISSSWSRESIALCIKSGLLSDEELYIRPLDNMTRAEVSTVVYRLIKKTD